MWILLYGCGTATTSIGTLPPNDSTESSLDSGLEDAPGVDDTGEETDTAEDEPKSTPEEDAAAQAGLFSDAVIHTVEIALSSDAERSLSRDPYEYAQADFTLDGEMVGTVGVRLRGKVGSFRSLGGKPKFKIDFGEYVDGQDFHGLKSLSLNNAVVDCSYLKESMAYRVYRDAGMPAGRTSFAHVTVNGENYGLYVVVEVPDGKFLKSRFPDDDDGNLYDGKYKYDENTGNYTMVDFATGVDDLFQLEEGVDNGHADVSLVSETIFASRGEGFDEALDPLVDWGEVHTNWAAEQWVGHVDGYAMNRNNYRVYFRPSDGRMMIVPWDFDYAFIEDSSWGMSWRSPNGKLAKGCWTDGSCAAAQVEAMQALTGTSEGEGAVNTDSLLEYYDAMAALIEDEAMDDPKRECSARNVRDYQSSVRSWIQTRSGSMRSYWGI